MLYIVDGIRTPFIKFGTSFVDEPPAYLGISASKALFTRTGVNPEDVDETVFGCCNQPGTTIGNIARSISVRSGVPESVPAVTVHRNCASGFEAITYACDKAANKKGNVFLVGGVESMSQAPFLFNRNAVKKFTKLSRSKTLPQKLAAACSFRTSDFSPEVALKKGLVDNLCDMGMGHTAELLAREYNITRKQQDKFSELSHYKAIAARASNRFADQIAPYFLSNNNCINSPSGKTIIEDNGPRNDATVQRLSKLKPVFDRREGTITAGNASQVTDGAAALLLMTLEGLEKTGATPIGLIDDYAYAGCDPKRMGLGPVAAVNKLGRDIAEADLVEINEAFAAQVLACQSYLKVPKDKLNVNGGAIALGHPLAATGARLVINLIDELKHRNLSSGLATLCVGGGQGGALWLKAML